MLPVCLSDGQGKVNIRRSSYFEIIPNIECTHNFYTVPWPVSAGSLGACLVMGRNCLYFNRRKRVVMVQAVFVAFFFSSIAGILCLVTIF